jgi:arginine/lysine/ornithine decarboxylase
MWDRCIELGIETRKKFREFQNYFMRNGRDEQEQWFFDPFVPDRVSIRDSRFTADVTDMPWEDLPTTVIKNEQQCWLFQSMNSQSTNSQSANGQPQSSWHGYSGYVDGYAMVDPNKLMLITPGIDRKTHAYLDWGVPATVVANFLREERVIPEKCDLNSILFLMTPAEDESKLNTLIAKLVKFKNLWDNDAPLHEVLPSLYAAHSERYAGYSLRQICNEMHKFYRNANVKELQRLCFRASSFPELAMAPKDAYEALVANNVDYVPMDGAGTTGVEGRISATLALIYPPGIGVVVPGERWDARARPMLDYFLTFQESFNRFPGFNYEVQGVYQEKENNRIRFFTYVVRE